MLMQSYFNIAYCFSNIICTARENAFANNTTFNQRKPMLFIITGDFNARSSSWWANDSTTFEGTSLYSLTSSNSFCQLINEPTHIQRNSSSCIDLIFTDQPSLAVNSGVHASLHRNCHQQII